MPSLIEQSGGQPQKQPKYGAVFIDEHFTGLVTQRAVLHDPSGLYERKFLGGRPDTLITGRNIELTNALTLQRRPGLSLFSSVTYPTPPDRAFSFQLATGAIQTIIDTGSTGPMVVSAAGNASGGNTVYTGVFPFGASNGLANLWLTISGFVTNPQNNGTFNVVSSTGTTVTVSNPNGVAESITASAVSAGAVYLDNQNGTKLQLRAKLAGAGQSYFIAVAGVMYVGDGVSVWKYTPFNTNGTIWNWGIVAPTVQPGVVVTPSGSAATQWQASTVFSTMGLTKDGNATPQIWQVIGVNADGSNTANAVFGTTGTGEPNWAAAPVEGNTLIDNTVTWTNLGALNDWQPSSFYTDLGSAGVGGENYSKPGAIALASKSTLYGNYANSGGLGQTGTAPNEPHFSGAYPGPSGGYFDNSCHWFAIGSYATAAGMKNMRWKQSHAYALWHTIGSPATINGSNSDIVLTGNLPAAPGTTVFLFVPTTGGTSGSGYNPFTANSAGKIVNDGQVSWLCLGQAAWQANFAYVPWTSAGTGFGCVFDPVTSTFQVCTKATGNSQNPGPPTFASGYGSTTQDGGVTWTCVGPTVNWAAAQIWNLPLAGFQPPSQSQPYGGSQVVGGGDVQAVIASGTSQNPGPPSWSTIASTPPTTTDGTITWQAVAAVSTNSLASSFGFAWAYAYKARPLNDFYSPTSVGGGGAIPPGPNPGGINVALGVPLGSETNAISSASPANQIVGADSGAVYTISGRYSPDPQVDTIVIYRSADSASGSANMFELTEIPNIPSLANTGATFDWTFTDFLPSTPTGVYPGLNVLLPAPINGVNNPPLSTYLPQVYNYQRIWGSNGQSVSFSAGPDIGVGNPNEAFNISDELPFLAPVIRLIRTPQGIVTFLTDSVEMIQGGPATATFFSTTMVPGVGLLSYNFCDVFAGEIYFFSSDNKFYAITPSLNLVEMGFALGDQFANQPLFGTSDATWNPSTGYLAIHKNGTDSAIFIADGSTGWYRLNPRQVPGGVQGPEPIWSPFAAVTGGCKMVQSVETAPGIHQLLVGGVSPNTSILKRDLTVYTDNTTQYDAFFVMGSISLAHRGSVALLKFMEMDFSGVGYQPTVSYLLNEISGSFTPFVNGTFGVPQFDPPTLYGDTISPTSYSPNRYFFSATGQLARCVHMQIRVDLGTTPNGDQLYNLTIFGRPIVEA